MFEKIRVLVVDDSAFMRKMISDMIMSQPDMEVLDTARNGEEAITKFALLKPDVITLDVEMPKVNGLEALKIIKRTGTVEVIMLSSLTSEGSVYTIEALHNGAFDFIQKPSGSISLDIEKVKDDLVEKIRYARSYNKRVKSYKNNELDNKKVIPPVEYNAVTSRIEAVVLGASTGGPRVLYDFITKLPETLNVPVFVVQHMPAGFTKAFAERLDKNSRLTVTEAFDGQLIRPNVVYIAPGGYHMTVSGNHIGLDTTPSMHGVRPAVDKLFISAAEVYKDKLLACIFTGMGKDGAEGVKRIKSYRGYIIAQDEHSSTVYGMPRAAFETGCVDKVLSDTKIADEVIKVVKRV